MSPERKAAGTYILLLSLMFSYCKAFSKTGGGILTNTVSLLHISATDLHSISIDILIWAIQKLVSLERLYSKFIIDHC